MFLTAFLVNLLFHWVLATQDSIRLFDDLMVDYNNHLRPSDGLRNSTVVHIRLSLSQIIELDEINQIMMCAVWLRQTWKDYRLTWDPKEYGQIDVLHVPYEIIWVPDIVLYNAEAENNITISTKATVYYTGDIVWEPPALFRTFCQMDVQWFPFDEQRCFLKFGSWSFPKRLVDLKFIDNSGFFNDSDIRISDDEMTSDQGIDLSDYYPSVEWDVMSIKALRRSKVYIGCCPESGDFVDLTFELLLRRKPLFYTVNLLMPNVFMACLTPFVFYLPCESGEKIQLVISILVSVAFYFLILTEVMPASGTTLPLISKYLLFTMLMVSASSAFTVLVLNTYYRKPTTHSMSSTARHLLLKWLPKVLGMNRDRLPTKKSNMETVSMLFNKDGGTAQRKRRGTMSTLSKQLCRDLVKAPHDDRLKTLYYSKQVFKCLENVGFISQLIRKKRCDHETEEDWKYASAVLDRFFLWLFQLLSIIGTIWVFIDTPLFYDDRMPITLPQSVVSVDELVRLRIKNL
ncbi:unnamed protein product [Bursaphelenchus xylophilus]|uniref:(pine wood nematode) hypothetical protein n=1 Tax=Bursaphelenchus xylophilus TaxID=6326 RepID=A0A1I7SGN2_BURXY|nr:unnamed protein product [Bursaphelenchus xylophilus]CAG9085321.1 unnamed protein product [Bursaphelenchus xylophilus]